MGNSDGISPHTLIDQLIGQIPESLMQVLFFVLRLWAKGQPGRTIINSRWR